MMNLKRDQIWQLIKCAKGEDEFGAARMAFQVSITPDVVAEIMSRLESLEQKNLYLREKHDEWERKALSNFEECAKLSEQQEVLLKFIRDRCYTFEGEQHEYSDAYLSATASLCLLPSKLKATEPARQTILMEQKDEQINR